MRMTRHTTTSAYVPPPPDRMRDALATLLQSAANDDAIEESAVRGAVFAYVRQLRAAALPPERVLVTIKGVANRSGVPDSRHDDLTPSTGRAGLMRKVVGWSIEAYYRVD